MKKYIKAVVHSCPKECKHAVFDKDGMCITLHKMTKVGGKETYPKLTLGGGCIHCDTDPVTTDDINAMPLDPETKKPVTMHYYNNVKFELRRAS